MCGAAIHSGIAKRKFETCEPNDQRQSIRQTRPARYDWYTRDYRSFSIAISTQIRWQISRWFPQRSISRSSRSVRSILSINISTKPVPTQRRLWPLCRRKSMLDRAGGTLDGFEVDDWILQARSVSTDIRAIPTNVSTPAGESLRVLITVSEDALRDKWLCHLYVPPFPIRVEDCRAGSFLIKYQWMLRKIGKRSTERQLTPFLHTDWFRFKQEDSSHDAIRPQGFPRQQHPWCWPSPYA